MIKQYIFRDKRTHSKISSKMEITNRDNGTRFLHVKKIQKGIFGLEIEIQELGI
jgi:hypothetical protein